MLCKIYRKATSIKVLEQRAAMEETQPPQSPSLIHSQVRRPITSTHVASDLEEEESKIHTGKEPSLKLPIGTDKLSELRLPKTDMDWSHDSQLRSPWLHNLIFTPPPYANILNF